MSPRLAMPAQPAGGGEDTAAGSVEARRAAMVRFPSGPMFIADQPKPSDFPLLNHRWRWRRSKRPRARSLRCYWNISVRSHLVASCTPPPAAPVELVAVAVAVGTVCFFCCDGGPGAEPQG